MDRVPFMIVVVLTVLQFVPVVYTEDDFEYKVLPPVYNIGEPPATPVFYPPSAPLSPSPSPKPTQPTPPPPPPPTSKPTQPTTHPSPTPKPTQPTTHPSPTPKPTLSPTKPPSAPSPPKTRRRKPHTTPTPISQSVHATRLPVRKHKPTRKPVAGVVYKPVNNEEPKRYTFKYDVEEDGAKYTHSEASDGNGVSGFFRLRLPNNHHHDFTYVAG
ncbi:extensin-like [Penaeus japonicus]|uniref:extensin-like n=1 Tax=Penaeus japonicus TaxID=27405 RepID=UPI001C713778|nr:extensin-like [Penaeus japonicus]